MKSVIVVLTSRTFWLCANRYYFWIRNWSHIAPHVVVLVVVVLLIGATSLIKKPTLCRSFQIGSGWWHLAAMYSLRIDWWTDGVRFSIWRHTFKTAAQKLYHAEKRCHAASVHTASAERICNIVRHASSWSVVHSYLLVSFVVKFLFWPLVLCGRLLLTERSHISVICVQTNMFFLLIFSLLFSSYDHASFFTDA